MADYTRVYTGDDGLSHFEDLDFRLWRPVWGPDSCGTRGRGGKRQPGQRYWCCVQEVRAREFRQTPSSQKAVCDCADRQPGRTNRR